MFLKLTSECVIIRKNIKLIRSELGLRQTDVIARLQVMGIKISIYSY